MKTPKDDSTKINFLDTGPYPPLPETIKVSDEMVEGLTRIFDRHAKATEQRRQAGRKPKRRQAIYEFVKIMQRENPRLSAEALFRMIKRSYPGHCPYQIDNYNVSCTDTELYQEQEDAENQSVKNVKSIKY